MGDLSQTAKDLVKAEWERRKAEGLPYDRGTLAFIFDTYPTIVSNILYKDGFEMGSVQARKIIAASMGSNYKANRETSPRLPWQL